MMEKPFITFRHLSLSDKKSEVLNRLKKNLEDSWFVGEIDDHELLWMKNFDDKKLKYSIDIHYTECYVDYISVHHGNSTLDVKYEKKYISDLMSPYFATGKRPEVEVVHDDMGYPFYVAKVDGKRIVASVLIDLLIKEYEMVNRIRLPVFGDILFDNDCFFAYKNQKLSHDKYSCTCDIKVDNYGNSVYLLNIREEEERIPTINLKTLLVNDIVMKINNCPFVVPDNWHLIVDFDDKIIKLCQN